MTEPYASYHTVHETAEAELTDVRLVTVEIESITASPEALEALVHTLLTGGLARYQRRGKLGAFDTLRVLQRPAHTLTRDELRLRRMAEDALRHTRRIAERRLPFTVEAVEQPALPGLEEGARR